MPSDDSDDGGYRDLPPDSSLEDEIEHWKREIRICQRHQKSFEAELEEAKAIAARDGLDICPGEMGRGRLAWGGQLERRIKEAELKLQAAQNALALQHVHENGIDNKVASSTGSVSTSWCTDHASTAKEKDQLGRRRGDHSIMTKHAGSAENSEHSAEDWPDKFLYPQDDDGSSADGSAVRSRVWSVRSSVCLQM